MSNHDERRRLPRRRTRQSAVAVSDAGEVACTIRDHSETGAKLLLAAGASVPDGFHLLELSTGDLHRAQVVWRDAAFVGVTLHETRNLDRKAGSDDLRFASLRQRMTARAGR